MRPAKPPNNKCPQDAERESCNLTCKFNYFESEELSIHSWELKCLDCGYRETIAYRSDDEDLEPDCEADRCPFCGLKDLKPGKNPC